MNFSVTTLLMSNAFPSIYFHSFNILGELYHTFPDDDLKGRDKYIQNPRFIQCFLIRSLMLFHTPLSTSIKMSDMHKIVINLPCTWQVLSVYFVYAKTGG